MDLKYTNTLSSSSASLNLPFPSPPPRPLFLDKQTNKKQSGIILSPPKKKKKKAHRQLLSQYFPGRKRFKHLRNPAETAVDASDHKEIAYDCFLTHVIIHVTLTTAWT